MPYRILVDENIDPQTTDRLREQGHDATHIETTLGKGTEDPTVAAHAREHGYVVLTNDTDFLRPERRQGLTVLYCPENAMRAHEVASLIGELETVVPEQDDLPAVTWVTDNLRS
ncbi:DUF5615 family PIN-like protein [Saliphagus sp. LR7]|uniref:DUF5615 family PIN-like protein n=1 Tax=Saliphagus sp. LR7 TaxID=2282654 RepID=UPI0013007C2F|nr:DUF5615 family PIN-like protein [Saliphagus sp. LR7]